MSPRVNLVSRAGGQSGLGGAQYESRIQGLGAISPASNPSESEEIWTPFLRQGAIT
jgi:hypothetical protein